MKKDIISLKVASINVKGEFQGWEEWLCPMDQIERIGDLGDCPLPKGLHSQYYIKINGSRVGLTKKDFDALKELLFNQPIFDVKEDF